MTHPRLCFIELTDGIYVQLFLSELKGFDYYLMSFHIQTHSNRRDKSCVVIIHEHKDLPVEIVK